MKKLPTSERLRKEIDEIINGKLEEDEDLFK